MDLYNLLNIQLFLIIPFVCYVLFFRKNNGRNIYTNRDLFYPIKYYLSRSRVKDIQESRKKKREKFGFEYEPDLKKFSSEQCSYYQSFHGCDQKGNSINLKFTVRPSKIAEVILFLRLSNGRAFTIPGSQRVYLASVKEHQWRINGLIIESLEPYIRLRIVYNGLLQDISCTNYQKIEHVQFNFIFNSCSRPQFYPEDIDTDLLTESLATSAWKDATWKHFLQKQSRGYDQFGALLGFVKADSITEELILNLPACRSKYHGKDDRYVVERGINIFLAEKNGVLINLNLKLFHSEQLILNYGHVIHKDNRTVPITSQDLRIEHVGKNKSIPDLFVVHVNTKTDEYSCVFNLNKSLMYSANLTNNFELLSVESQCNVNISRGKALIDFWYYNERIFDVPKLPPLLHEKKIEPLPATLVVNIKDDEAKIVDLTGGKGTSLALLASLNSTEFTIPDGIILTVNAFKQHISNCIDIVNAIKNVEDIFCGKIDGDREEKCKEAVHVLQNEPVSPELTDVILTELGKIKQYLNSDDITSISWAVRSSAMGEDSEELSAAGQNETILGCRSDKEIISAVATCWASLYTYQSVQYRWQHGLPIQTDMAVVVQRMVPSDAAGVLFTWHPSTSNPSQMVITSNYGLGESVVSGNAEPDTFILNRTYDGQICLLDESIGSKSKVLKLTEDGVKEIGADEFLIVGYEDNWSITKEQATKLGKIGLDLEKAFGGPRDIEWAFYKNKLYLLQSRPITTLHTWSEFELTHEFDYPTLTENNILTIANVGEVYPVAVTALGEIISKVIDRGLQLRICGYVNPFTQNSNVTSHHRLLLDVVLTIHKNAKKEIEMPSKILDLAIFGHVVINEHINQIVLDRLGPSKKMEDVKELLRMLSYSWNSKKLVKKAEKLANTLDYCIDDGDEPRTVLQKIKAKLNTLEILCYYHGIITSASVFWQIISMNILIGKAKELKEEYYTDFASILLSCDDVVSAEVPVYLEKIAKTIKEKGLADDFNQVDPINGTEWLSMNCPEAYKIFQEFLEKHGHRAIGEFEISTETWGLNPSKVIPMIQANTIHMNHVTKDSKTIDDILNGLVSPITPGKRRALKYIISKLKTVVGLREQTKSHCIFGIHKTRLAFRKLAKLMVQHGLLPSEDLIFHLTHHELAEVIEKRNPLLLIKATQRQRLYPKWSNLKFPELVYGLPQPLKDTELRIELQEGSKCVGTPASMGNVQSRACVITTLDEIGQLQKGDILITYSTDIGWSPYFPMLSGVVTELGGLISHGAVVAREYGLPCIVGVKNVTKIFKTGDIVYLSGKTGELGKVE
ncbi:rifampicin phosphotransferase-like [Rhynchophorus ferrugineus]|uniref:rifampicin phosphotransferase-like n=1 Tax=Rhynchophorus ferrugineus TaxID=354439 RepID=UPI003FCEBD5B